MTYSSEFPVTTSQSQTHQNPPPIDRLIQPQNQPIGTNLGEPYLRIEGVNKSFGSFVALREIYLDVYPGEFVCLLGPSGCGKTTLLRIIAGLEQQTSGRVIQGGKDVSNLPTSRRDFGIVFQSYALFPNLTVEQNIGYGLHNEGRPKSEIQAKVNELIDLVGLEGNAHKYPSQMSGGQQQRVALARALAQSPGLLLLDEPLSALDAKVREKLRSEITHLQKRLGITTVMVTHDQAEALSMADRVVVMDKGYIAQVGTPHNIYQEPNSPFVANFIGIMNFLKGIVLASNQVCCGNITLSTGVQVLEPIHSNVTIAIRPEDIKFLGEVGAISSPLLDRPNVLIANINSLEFLGAGYLVNVSLEGDSREEILVNLPIEIARKINFNSSQCRLALQLPPELIKIFPTA